MAVELARLSRLSSTSLSGDFNAAETNNQPKEREGRDDRREWKVEVLTGGSYCRRGNAPMILTAETSAYQPFKPVHSRGTAVCERIYKRNTCATTNGVQRTRGQTNAWLRDGSKALAGFTIG